MTTLKGIGRPHTDDKSGRQEGRRWEDGRLIQSVRIPYSTLMLGGNAIFAPHPVIQSGST